MKLEVLKKINNTSKFNGIRVREIIFIVRNIFPNTIYIRIDIYNARVRFRRKNLNRYIPISALIKLFNDNGFEYIKKIDPNDENRLLGLIFTFLDCIKLAKLNLEVNSFISNL